MVREIEYAIDAVQVLIENLTSDLASGKVSESDYRFVVGQIRGMRLAINEMSQITDEDDEVE